MGKVKEAKKDWGEDQGLELATADFFPGALALQVALGLDSANLFDLGTFLAELAKSDDFFATPTPLGALGLDLASDNFLPALACGGLTLLVPLDIELAALDILLIKSATLYAVVFVFGFALFRALDASDLGLPLKSDLCKCCSCECKQCEEGDSE